MYDLVVLGDGPEGLLVAESAAKVGASVALVRTGTAASGSAPAARMALIRAARLAHEIRSAAALGLRASAPELDLPALRACLRVAEAGANQAQVDEALRADGVEVVVGSPAFEAYDTVLVDGTTRISAQRFVIATGSRSAVPSIPGLAEAGFLDDRTLERLEEFPPTLVVLGSGPEALELGQAFARLGSKVTVLADSERVLPHEDPDVSALVTQTLTAEGITVVTGVDVHQVDRRDGLKVCHYRKKGPAGGHGEAAGAQILLALGRLPNIENLHLEAAGIHADSTAGIQVDDYLQTRSQRVYALGDVTRRTFHARALEREAAIAFQNAVLRIPKKLDPSALPRGAYLDPEVASVGLTEPEAREQHPEHRIFRSDVSAPTGRTGGFLKVVTAPSGKILGASIVAEDASLILQEFVLALEHGLALGDVATAGHLNARHAALAHSLANQFAAARLERPFVQTALRWFLGLRPRSASGDGETADHAQAHPQPAGHDNGHGHH